MRACKAPEPLTSAPTSERIPESRWPRRARARAAAGRCAFEDEAVGKCGKSGDRAPAGCGNRIAVGSEVPSCQAVLAIQWL